MLIVAIVAAALAFGRWAFGRAQWLVIQANSTLLAVGRYPIEQQWRLWLLVGLLAAATGLGWGLLRGRRWPFNDRLAAGLLVALGLWAPAALALSLPLQLRWWAITALLLALRWAFGRWGTAWLQRLPAAQRRLLPLGWPLLYVVGLWLIAGGLGLGSVAPSEWGGLLLTLLLASLAMLLSFPLGVLLALGRRSELPLLRWGSVLYIEFIRGAPLITLLFLGQNILGFLLPGASPPIGSGGPRRCSRCSVPPTWPKRCAPVWRRCPGARWRRPDPWGFPCSRPSAPWCCPRPCAPPCPPWWGSSSPCCRTPPCSH